MSQAAAVWGTDDHMMVKGVNWRLMREKLGADAVPSAKPENEEPFWKALFGGDVFYWDTDVF
jgi:hypothetical protein